MRIGVAGLGKMGSAMAARLKEAGEDVVVWNRTRDRAEATGLPVADTPRALAEQVDTVVSMLFDDQAVLQVFRGASGLIEAAPGKMFIEMSTVRPGTHARLAEDVRNAGGAYVECPVGGSTGPARTGKLLGLAGGDPVDVTRARPVLDVLCRRVEHVGPVGAGASMKLAINLPLLVFWQAFGEANALIRHLHLDSEFLVALFSDTSGGANVLKARGPAIAAALSGRNPGIPSFDINSIRKDLQTMLAEARDHGFTLPVSRAHPLRVRPGGRGGPRQERLRPAPSLLGGEGRADRRGRRLMARMTLDLASRIVDAALATGRERGFMPLSVAVLDAGGHLVAFKREDGSGILRFDIAFGKAWGALGMGFGSRELFNRTQANPTFMSALSTVSGGRVVPVPSGVLILSEGEVIGAVGISGDNSDNDETCALAGIAAVGLEAKPGL